MNNSDLISTSIQRKIMVGTQPIKLSTSMKVVCKSDFGCMTSPPICDVATTLLKLDYRYSKIHYYTVSCMRQGMLTLSGAPSTTSHLDINILSILHHLGSPLG